ncbi:MAG: FkbM family methyltransferase [Telmatospirillum sp.]|nr:FkbM family methyltransferase [Telmatospirillum sp.]
MMVNRNDHHTDAFATFGVGHEIFGTSSCGQEEIDVALQLLDARKEYFGAGVVALDCGANIGVHTIEWAKHMHGWGTVTAFEAQEKIFYALAGNIAMNNCFNARAVWTAIGAADGTIRVPVPDYLKPSSFGSLEIRKTDKTEFIGQDVDYSAAKTVETTMRAIDSFALKRLDFMKIDIEGMEMEALAGARNTIAAHKPIMLIEGIKTDLGALTAYLNEMGYRYFTFGINVIAIHTSDPYSARVISKP